MRKRYFWEGVLRLFDFFEDCELVAILEGRFHVVDLVDDAAQGPEVCRRGTVVLLQQLGRYVAE